MTKEYSNWEFGYSTKHLDNERGDKLDLTGRRFGMLEVVGLDTNNKNKGIYWMCICDCQRNERVPKQRSIRQDKLLEGRTKSCGCLKRKQETRSKRITNCFDTISCDYGIGTTSKGEKFYFDKEDLGRISSVSSSWSFNDAGYLEARDMRDCAEKYSNNGRRKMVKLKDIIMNKQPNEIIKYINPKNKFDNRKTNLRKIKTGE